VNEIGIELGELCTIQSQKNSIMFTSINFLRSVFNSFSQKVILLAIIILAFANSSFGQKKKLPYSNKLTIVTGLTQPLLLDGFNLAINYTTNCWVFEYSHGINLHYSNEILKPNYRDNIISMKSPFSTGAGAGFRIFAKPILSMDIRAEAKVHQYDVQLNDVEEISYRNFDLGGGMYFQIRPFGKKNNALQGFVIEPSIRYWANVSSTLDDNFTYQNNADETIIHNPYPLNLFGNISVGYTFDF